jgi:hypothetical protein
MKTTQIEVIGFDTNGCEVDRNDVFESRKQAREFAERLIKDTEFLEAGLARVELRVDGQCINDWLTSSEGRPS